ncbi:MAG: glycoside hydrolase 5 family protein [Actinomycetota bacterium]
MPADPRGFRLGVNYWPARTAMGWWPTFEPAEVATDFARIAAAGMDSVRCFLRWEDFQPEPDRIEHAMLGHLVTVADAAARAELQLMPTLFTGHMSGVNWIPGWALGGRERDPRFRVVSGGRIATGGLRNWFTDADLMRSQALLASEAAAALAGHDALWAWDLGNENSNCSVPPDRELGRRWLGEMTGAIRRADPDARITIGLHMEDLEEDRHLGPREAAEACDFLTMHGYPIYARWADGPLDHALVPFLARIARWLGDGKDVLFSEFGLPTFRARDQADDAPRPGSSVDEEAAASYTERVLGGLRDAGTFGAMLWCYADYAPERWADPPLDEAPHERSFGLWRADGSAKPAVPIVTAAAGRTRVAPPGDGWIDIDRERFWARPGVELPRLYARYRARHPG